jgi:hypothetical protein
VARLKCPSQESFGRLGIAGLIEQEFQGITCRIHHPVQVQPLPFDFDVGLIYSPGGLGSASGEACSAFLALARIAGPSDRWWCGHCETSLGHHLFQIPIAEAVTQVPAYAQQDDWAFEMAPLEGAG